jgi:hypothetical protein
VPYEIQGDARWLDEWQREAQPIAEEFSFIQRWLNGLKEDPRQRPSAESPREHPHVLDELRGAFLLGAGGAFVVYAIDEIEHIVRVLHIGADPPEGVVFRLPT